MQSLQIRALCAIVNKHNKEINKNLISRIFITKQHCNKQHITVVRLLQMCP